MKRKNIIQVVSLLFSGLFIYSGSYKLADLEGLKNQMTGTPLIERFSGLAWLVPALELGLAVCLWIPIMRPRALIFSTGLMCVFTIYLFYLYSGPYLSCNCGGFIENLPPTLHIVFNLGFLGLGIFSIIINYCMQPLPARSNRRSRKPV